MKCLSTTSPIPNIEPTYAKASVDRHGAQRKILKTKLDDLEKNGLTGENRSPVFS